MCVQNFSSLAGLEVVSNFEEVLNLMALNDIELVLEKSWNYFEVVLIKSWSSLNNSCFTVIKFIIVFEVSKVFLNFLRF